MATTFKLLASAATDGVAYIDLPVSGRITSVSWSVYMIAGAGGVGTWVPELSRQAVHQVTTNNPRGVISAIAVNTAAASIPGNSQRTDFPNEPVKSGERLYLNCSIASNFSTGYAQCYVTVG